MNGTIINSYPYDDNGNRLNNNSVHDAQDRLLSDSNATYLYTQRGSLAEKNDSNGVTKYEYDANGNLLSVDLPNGTQIEYVIDPRNRRVAKKVNGTIVQKFLYGDQLNPVAELDENNEIISLFVYGTRSNVPDYMIKNGQKYKFVTNHLGSVVKVINTNNGARDYDPNIGRWTSKDPIKFDGGRNFYGYAGNNPVNFVDLDGLHMIDPVLDTPMDDPLGSLNYVGDYIVDKVKMLLTWLINKYVDCGAGALNKAEEIYSEGKILLSDVGYFYNDFEYYNLGEQTPRGRIFTSHGALRANERNFTAHIIDSIIDNNKKKRVKETDKETGIQGWRYQDKKGNTVVLDYNTNTKIITVYSYPKYKNGGNYIP